MTDYDAIKAVNFSGLMPISVSPKLYRWYQDGNKREDKPEFTLGSAAHCAILEPDEFEKRYAVYEPVRNGKAWEKWLEEHPGVTSLKPHEMEKALKIRDAVHADRVAGPLIRGGRSEVTVTWNDAATGLACKCRVDKLQPGFLLDLKSARDPSPQVFTNAASKLGYQAKMAFYQDGAVAARLIDGKTRPYIIAVRSGMDFDVVVYQLSQDAFLYGRDYYRSLLRKLLECIEAKFWPGVAPDLQELGISAYAPEPYAATESGEDF